MKNRWTLLLPYLIVVMLSISGCTVAESVFINLAAIAQELSNADVTVERVSEGSESSTEPASYIGRLTTDWLVTADELDSLTTESLEISIWQEAQAFVWNHRTCRMLVGVSISVSPNEAVNCIFTTEPGIPFEQIIEGMYEWEILPADAVSVEVDLGFSSEHSLFIYQAPWNGHTVFDALLFGKRENILYWASITMATGIGATPSTVHEMVGDEVEQVLAQILHLNMERLNAEPATAEHGQR
jgi:hypothetical protein